MEIRPGRERRDRKVADRRPGASLGAIALVRGVRTNTDAIVRAGETRRSQRGPDRVAGPRDGLLLSGKCHRAGSWTRLAP